MAEAFIGEIRITPYNFAPVGWALCNGQILSMSQNTALFSLFGTTYGGTARPPSACRTCKTARRSSKGKGPACRPMTSVRRAASRP